MNRKLTLTALLALTAICASAQIAPDTDWAQFGRYAADNVACNTGCISPENILGNIKSMCELAKAHKIRPVLCSVTPSVQFRWRKSVTGVAEKIAELNGMIKAYAHQNRIPYVDYHSALAAEDGSFPRKYSYDGVHPGLAGYKIMEPLLLSILK